MILLLIFLPLISFLFTALFARYIGRAGSAMLTTIIMFMNVILTCIMFYKISVCGRLYFINIGTWISSDSFQVNWSFYLDNLTITMLLVVNIVSALVHLYSMDYMSQDPHLPRFMAYLSLFTFFMLMLVTGDNFVILFLGWEGVGLCSYLLISFWYTRLQANKAAIKALIVNRVADLALTIAMVLIFFVFNSLDFHVVFPLAPFFVKSTFVFLHYDVPVLTTICSLLFVGAMGKSAQIGLHTWLPDAMEGPTPVSALIHAATMVTAGVFLIIKCSPLFEYVPTVLSMITLIGATTAFFSATIGLVQNDIKKVIAYSTCSQLGYMIFACGLSNYHVSLFHLANHAFFKALLFLSAGAIIHSLSNEQDMRKYGGLLALLPYTATMLLIGSLSLMGFPFLTGFYSKDLILELALTKYTVEGSFAYCLGLITAFFTSYYSFRVFYMTFIYRTNSYRAVISHVHELPWKMALSLAVLSLGSIFLGYFAKDLFIGLGTDFWNHSILILPEHNNQLDAEFFGLPNLSSPEFQTLWNSTYGQGWLKLLPFYCSLLAVALVCVLFSHSKNPSTKPFAKGLSKGLNLTAPQKPQQRKTVSLRHQMTSYPRVRLSRKERLERLKLLQATRWQRKKDELQRVRLARKERLARLKLLQSMLGQRKKHLSREERLARLKLLQANRRPQKKTERKKTSFQGKVLYNDEATRLITLYTPVGFLQEYQKTGRFTLPYSSDSPLTPHTEIIKNEEYYYYQKLVWDVQQKKSAPSTKKQLYAFLSSKWYFDAIYNEFLNRPLWKMAYTTLFRSLDKGVLEYFGPYGIASALFWSAHQMKHMQVGQIYYYGYVMLMFLLVSFLAFSYVQ